MSEELIYEDELNRLTRQPTISSINPPSGVHGVELTVVGDFDPQKTLPVVQQMLSGWEASQPFAEWRRRLEPLLRDDVTVDSVSDMETWFTLPGHSVVVPPPKYKMAVVASVGAAPFVLILIPLLISTLEGIVPPIVVALIILVIMSTAMTWGTMPLLSWLARRWLYPVK